jgi:hypothetical protein
MLPSPMLDSVTIASSSFPRSSVRRETPAWLRVGRGCRRRHAQLSLHLPQPQRVTLNPQREFGHLVPSQASGDEVSPPLLGTASSQRHPSELLESPSELLASPHELSASPSEL